MKESQFQSGLIKDLKNRFEGCIVIKNDARNITKYIYSSFKTAVLSHIGMGNYFSEEELSPYKSLYCKEKPSKSAQNYSDK